MSSLLLIRHGQARAYEPDSDRLSDIGEAQARRLGEYLIAEGFEFDEVFSGTLERQRRTLALVGGAFDEAGRPWPSPVEDAAWNEYDAPGVLGTLLPALAARDDAFKALVDAFQTGLGGADRNRHFQRMFEVLMDAWERGGIDADGVEPFDAFHSRVGRALTAMLERGGNRRIAVFTSGGPIGVCVQSTLGAPRGAALRLNWRVKNASLTEFIFSKGRISMEYFNACSFLAAPLRTFR